MLTLAFLEQAWNKNSLAVLSGALEESALAPRVRVLFVKPRQQAGAFEADGVLGAPGRRPDGPLVLAASFHTSDVIATAENTAHLLARARATGVEPLLVAGGTHPSGDPAGTLGLGFDVVVQGEGEEALPALLERAADGRPWDDVPGLWWLEGGQVRHSGRSRPVDLDRYPPLAPRTGRHAPIELSRGCPWGCHFCQTTPLFGRHMRHRSLERVLYWLERARARGLKDLRFVSPDAFAWLSPDSRTPNPAPVEALLREAGRIMGREHVFFGGFPSEVRPETVTPELVGLVKRLTATETIVMGLQSGSERMLERAHRGHGLEVVYRAVATVREAGLTPIVDFICGLPGEEQADRAANRQAMQRLVGMGAVIHTHAFMPLPGSAWGRQPPGVIDAETRRLVARLAGAGTHIGRWHIQEERAARVREFLEGRA
jgi:B12-binding domain/radical SAM domain protein